MCALTRCPLPFPPLPPYPPHTHTPEQVRWLVLVPPGAGKGLPNQAPDRGVRLFTHVSSTVEAPTATSVEGAEGAAAHAAITAPRDVVDGVAALSPGGRSAAGVAPMVEVLRGAQLPSSAMAQQHAAVVPIPPNAGATTATLAGGFGSAAAANYVLAALTQSVGGNWDTVGVTSERAAANQTQGGAVGQQLPGQSSAPAALVAAPSIARGLLAAAGVQLQGSAGVAGDAHDKAVRKWQSVRMRAMEAAATAKRGPHTTQ